MVHFLWKKGDAVIPSVAPACGCVSATPAYPSAMILAESLTQFSFYCWSETTSTGSLTVTQSEKEIFQ